MRLIHPDNAEDIPEDLGWDENHMLVNIGENWFSFTQRGEAIQFHVFLPDVWKAVEDCTFFCNWLFDNHKWCRMLLVTINKRSLVKLAKRCGFSEIAAKRGWVVLGRDR